MDFGLQLIVALAIALAVVYPLYFSMAKKYRMEGRSIKYLWHKLCIGVMMPILSIPILLSDVFPPLHKVVVILVAALAGLANLYSVTSARKSFRKILGLPPEDEHTGEVIKEEDKKKDD